VAIASAGAFINEQLATQTAPAGTEAGVVREMFPICAPNVAYRLVWNICSRKVRGHWFMGKCSNGQYNLDSARNGDAASAGSMRGR
jgi:hypothetical protein